MLTWQRTAAPEPAGALFVLNDVFLDGEGRVFNATHRFDVSGCATSSSQTVYGVDTHVSRQETVLNLLLPGHFMERRPLYDQILMVLPPLLPLQHVLPSLRQAKVVTHAKKLLQLLISQLLGLPLAKHSFLSTTDASTTTTSKYLWHVKTLYQPVIPHCTNPDLPLWKHFRRRFLLPTPPPPDPSADSTTPTPALSSSSSARSLTEENPSSALTEENPSSALSDPASPLELVPKVPPGFLDGARSVFPSLPALPVEGYAQGGDLHGSWVPIGWQLVPKVPPGFLDGARSVFPSLPALPVEGYAQGGDLHGSWVPIGWQVPPGFLDGARSVFPSLPALPVEGYAQGGDLHGSWVPIGWQLVPKVPPGFLDGARSVFPSLPALPVEGYAQGGDLHGSWVPIGWLVPPGFLDGARSVFPSLPALPVEGYAQGGDLHGSWVPIGWQLVPKVPPGFLDGARSVFPSLPALPVEGYAQGGDLHGSWVPIGWQLVPKVPPGFLDGARSVFPSLPALPVEGYAQGGDLHGSWVPIGWQLVPKVPPGFLDGARSVFPSLPALPVEGYAQGGDLHGSWVPIGWQVVVAHDSMRCTRTLGQVEELLHRYFPPDRIVVFSSSRKIMEGKHLFNRAALFITCLGLAITNTMFMPPRAAVLDLRPPIPASHTTRYTLLSRSFASANDVRSFVLICQPGSDSDDVAAGSGQLECNTREIDDVIDRIAHDIYTSPAAVAAAMSPTRDAEAAAEALADAEANGRSLLRPTDLIRGSVLRSPLQVQKFRSWMKCVGQEGRWVYDPKPHRLPWWFMGKPYQCDSPMSGRHHGKSMEEADAIADAKGDPEEWTVRESLKYKWGVPANACPKVPVRSWEVEEEDEEEATGGRRFRGGDGRAVMRMTMRFSHSSWMKFSSAKFCERVGRGRLFLFLGDSLNEQFSEAFLNNLVVNLPKPVSEEHLRMEIPRYCSDWHNDSSVRHAFCKFYSVSDDVCPGLRAAYVRTDQLTLANPRLFDRQPWSRMEVIREADVIIINRGPHYEEDELYAPVLERALMYLRSRFPEKLIIWRNTPPGHANCSGQKTPLKKRQDPGILPYNWDKFARQNKLAEVIVKRYGAAYMDVDSMTALRADGHKEFVPAVNKVDCLHYCHPGPLDGWVEHLYNTLSWLMAPPPPVTA
ncbi:unnamed protein product [Closterium sp. Yama58-4]|nr:unnamed protein product [Closterium sp. Yama58-4]